MRDEVTKEYEDTIREVFLYLDRFKGSTFVFKIDYPVIASMILPVIVEDLAELHRMGIKVIVVAGARERIDEILGRYGIESRRAGDERISSPEAMPFIKMAAFDAANKIMTRLTAANVSAVIGNWVRARSMGVRDGVDFLSSGEVEKVRVDLIEKVLDQGFIPIFPCIGWNAAGEPYNVSSDTLAARLAEALRADKLFFITGETVQVMETPARLTVAEVGDWIRRHAGDADAPTRRLSQTLALAAGCCASGVERAHVLSGSGRESILLEIFSNLGSGIMIYVSKYQSLRPMRPDDIPDVLRIMRPYVERGYLVARDEETMMNTSQEYVVYEVDGSVHGCGGLHEYPGGAGEIVGIAVDQRYMELGIGRMIVGYLIEQATARGLGDLFLLTTQAADWFMQMGFKPASAEDLPEERRKRYDIIRKSRILRYRPSGRG